MQKVNTVRMAYVCINYIHTWMEAGTKIKYSVYLGNLLAYIEGHSLGTIIHPVTATGAVDMVSER